MVERLSEEGRQASTGQQVGFGGDDRRTPLSCQWRERMPATTGQRVSVGGGMGQRLGVQSAKADASDDGPARRYRRLLGGEDGPATLQGGRWR
jgi:hypothetical protein